ncbi:hypothetical protein [Actinocorallia populi]|uniref:hypothetical protein n=1 Tax=Actinocorallia populi TaxID=2079200 RepID=UPI000D096FCA|nr:hypothetical protein [Actinocorallia populi]
MTYRVEETDDALGVLIALPSDAVISYLEMRAALELDPWTGDPYRPDNPKADNSRVMAFASGCGMAHYVIIEHLQDPDRRVVIASVLWAG